MKADLRTLVARRSLDEVAARALESRRVLGRLVSLTYDADPAVAWGAVEAMGAAAAAVADEDPDFVRHHLRRLHWLLQEESGGICWYAPQAMAEIVALRPGLFADYLPIVANLLLETADEDLEHFREGMLWAVGRLGALVRDLVEDVLPAVVAALAHPDPQVRGTAAWCLRRLERTAELEAHPGLLDDRVTCTLFVAGGLHTLAVGQVAAGTEAVRSTPSPRSAGAVSGGGPHP